MPERRTLRPRTWRIFALVFGIVAVCELTVGLLDVFTSDGSGWLFILMGLCTSALAFLFLHVAKVQQK